MSYFPTRSVPLSVLTSDTSKLYSQGFADEVASHRDGDSNELQKVSPTKMSRELLYIYKGEEMRARKFFWETSRKNLDTRLQYIYTYYIKNHTQNRMLFFPRVTFRTLKCLPSFYIGIFNYVNDPARIEGARVLRRYNAHHLRVFDLFHACGRIIPRIK